MKFSKKILAAVLAALMAISMMPFSAFATEWTDKDVWGGDLQTGDILTSDVEKVWELGEYTLTLPAGGYADYYGVVNSDLVTTQWSIEGDESPWGKTLRIFDNTDITDSQVYYPYNENGFTNQWYVVDVNHDNQTITLSGSDPSTPTVNTYTVTWKNADGTTLETDTDVAEGTVPTYNGATPTKATDEKYMYFFSGWSPEVTAVTGDITYTAQFDKQLIGLYLMEGDVVDKDETIRFPLVTRGNNFSGHVLKVYLDGELVKSVEVPDASSIEPDRYYTTTQKCIVSQFSKGSQWPTIRNTIYLTSLHTVTWQNEDGTVLETDTDVAEGTVPTYDGATPTKAEDAQYTYSFAGWSPEVTAVTGDVTYTAVYSQSVRQYTVTWKNYDDSVIGTSTVNAGQTPEFSDSIGQIKAKPADENHSYEFTGWTPEIVAAEADAEYTATFVDVLSISNVDEWNSFAASVKDGNTYSGKIVRMTADVGPVTTMVGGTFSGTFDGGSHTLTVNISGGNASVATFEVVKDATIQNLTLAGSITSSGIHSAALVKSISGSGTSCTIKNVDIYADVNCAQDYIGGFIGHAGVSNTILIENSAYLGAINKTGNAQGNFIGGFIGWCQKATVTINNCAFTGSYSNIKSFNNIGFSYNASTNVTVNDFYSNATEVFVANVNHGTRLYVPDSGYTTAVALVNHGGEKTFFNQLSDALNAWVDGSTLMLMSDVTTASNISVGGNKTLDLNGYKLRISRNAQVISVQEGGDLTIKSSAQGGEVIGCNADRAVVGGRGYTLTLESGTIKTAASNCISGTDAVLNLNGGAIEGTSNSSDMTVASAVYCKGNCTANWNGTSITTNTGCGFYSNKTTDTVKIGGGSFAATADTLPDNAGYVLTNCNVEIQGAPVLNGKGIHLSNGKVINVTGELTNDVPIGVVMQTPGVFTSGLQGNGGIANFANGNGDDYGIGLDASGEAQVVRKYTVTWKLDETTVLATDKVLEGTVPTFTGTAPADYSDTYYNYTFAGWTPEVSAVTGDATYTAQYTAQAKTFTIFAKKLTGGTITVSNVTGLTTVAQLKDLLVTETGVPASEMRLIFAGKQLEDDKTLGEYNIQKESTLHLVFKSYAITWNNYDGSELITTNAFYGDTPVYDGETPTKPADALYTYSFAGWSPSVSTVTGAATYTATFNATQVNPDNGASITVAETISENFYLDDEFYGEDSFIAVNYNHNSNVSETNDFRTDVVAMNSLPELDDSTSEYNGARKFSVVQAPAQATETITINVYPTQADAEAGTNAIDTITYSVYNYCRQIITGDYAENLKDLARATLDYAASAQDYFDYNTENMATKDATGGFYNNVAGADLSSVAGVNAAPSCITKASVVVKSDLEINLFSLTPIEVTGASMDATKGKDRFAATSYQSGDYYVVHIAGIEPANMDNTITVNTSNGDIVMTANAIIKMMLNSNDAKLVTLAKAMYLYGAAANTYFD